MKRKEVHLLFSVSNHCHVKYLMGLINLVSSNSGEFYRVSSVGLQAVPSA
jgi:uncharacterized protein YjhX (UPF0386 family)